MNLHIEHQKSCDPQLFDSVPQDDWELDRLGDYARAQHEAITRSARSLATSYWRLGFALNLSRRHFSRGQWGKFLDNLSIDKTRASKACVIRRTFKTKEAIEGLSVKEAYARRKRRPRKSSAKTRRKSQERDGIAEWLLDVCDKADLFLDEARWVNPDHAASMLLAIDATIEELTNLRDRLQQRTSKS